MMCTKAFCALATILAIHIGSAIAFNPPRQQEATQQIPGSKYIKELDSFTFYPAITNGQVWFVDFYIDNCRSCKRAAPTWAELAESLKDHPEISIAKYNCDLGNDLCDTVDVRTTPSLMVFYEGQHVLTYEADVLHIDLLRPFIINRAKMLMHDSDSKA